MKLYATAIAALGLLCATGVGVAASAGGAAASSATVREHRAHDNAAADRHAGRILHLHNRERAHLGLPMLQWSPQLALEAREWGHTIARKGRLEHADASTRSGTGENLWMGTANAWPVDAMVGMFIDEKRHYRHGRFPEISRTGQWADVAHYTQVIWRDTQEVGCAVVTDRGWDVLVCRYYPAGNVWGRMAY